jgi:hypothetical protein
MLRGTNKWEVVTLIIVLSLAPSCEKKEATPAQGIEKPAGGAAVNLNITLSPTEAYVDKDISANLIGEKQGVKLQWLRNGAVIPGADTITLKAGIGNFAKNDTVIARAILPDGQTVESAPLIVKNSLPMVRLTDIVPPNPTSRDDVKVKVEAVDPDGDTVRVSYQWSINGEERVGYESQDLNHSSFKRGDRIKLTTTLSDGEETVGPISYEEFTISNISPKIVSAPQTAIVEGVYTYQVKAEDAEGDTLTYSLNKAPKGMSVDPRSGLIQWKPTKEDAGDQTIEVKVDDGNGGWATQSYTLSIASAEGATPH